VPYVRSSDAEVLARWYHEGLDAFEENLHGASEILHALEGDLRSALGACDRDATDRLIARSREERERIEAKLEHGYDRLLQLNSNKPGMASELARQIREADGDRAFESLFVRLLEYYGVNVDDWEGRTYLLREGHMLTDEFPEIPSEGMAVTFDRRRSLAREDLAFLSWDHPFVRSVIDLLTNGEAGNAAYGVLKTSARTGLVLEVCAIVEAVAPPGLHVDRFLPPQPLRVAIDHTLADVSSDAELRDAALRNGDIVRLLERDEIKRDLLPAMLECAHDRAAEAMQAVVADASGRMISQLQREIDRLEELAELNSHVTPEEISAMREHRLALDAAIQGARLRIEALRLIQCVP
jgi:ATP-dependent helicase HepA